LNIIFLKILNIQFHSNSQKDNLTIQSFDISSVSEHKCPHNRIPHLIIRILSNVLVKSVNCFSIIYSILINLSAQSVRRSIAKTKEKD
jgi:hypothetical protein